MKNEMSVWDIGFECVLERSGLEWGHVFYTHQQFENKLGLFLIWRILKDSLHRN